MVSRYLFLIALACTTGCARVRSPPPADQAASMDSLRAVVQGLVSEPTCDDVAQCRAMAFGAKPCGGPWSYLVYSVTASAAYNAREAEVNRQEGRVSDCRMVTAPAVECRDGTCVAVR
jgi:hypothetical protein